MSYLKSFFGGNAYKIFGAAYKHSASYRMRNNTTASISTANAVMQKYDKLDTKFDNAKESFKSKTNWELIRSLIVYQICSYDVLLDNTAFIMKWSRRILGHKLWVLMMKLTFYGHFVAGEDEVKIKPTLQRLHDFGVRSILDYSAEEDLEASEAIKREVKALTPQEGDHMDKDSIKQYHMTPDYADRRYKVSSARTFFYVNEDSCEKNLEITMKCLQAAAAFDSEGTGFAAVKLTALCKPAILLQLSEVIMKIRRYMAQIVGEQAEGNNVLKQHMAFDVLEKKFADAKFSDKAAVQAFLKQVTFDHDGVLHIFPWAAIINKSKELNEAFMVPDLKTGKIVSLISHLSKEEEEMFKNLINRIDTICKTAEKNKLQVMIDAEQTYFQPAISRLALEFMRKYNKEKAIVYNTYQAYLKCTYDDVATDLEQAMRQKFCFGAKLVRGAYLEQERERAATMKYPDPSCPSFEATTEMYHKTLMEFMNKLKVYKDKGEKNKLIIFVASHNEDTVRFAIQNMEKIGIKPSEKCVCFGQLLGMCDNMTFPLGQAGYPAYKYVPFGPVEEVMPYLTRRGTENKGILTKIKKEKRLLRSEVLRRWTSGQFVYTPKGNYKPV